MRLVTRRRSPEGAAPQGDGEAPPPPSRGTLWAGLAGFGLGLLALGPGIGPGYLLSYDMVFVPTPPFTAAMFGRGGTLPRAVPSDLFVAVCARLLPADVVQKLLLLSIFVLACSGAAALLAGEHWLARLAAGVFYSWNPFVAERLILGQWALALGYAGLPWVLRSAGDVAPSLRRRAARLALALLPAAIGGFAPMCLSGLVALPVAAVAAARSGQRRIAAPATALVVLGVLSLPWLVPALSGVVHTSAAGVAAFAARADTPFGAAGSLVMLGGVWNSQVVPAGYGGPASAAWLAIVVLALAGFLMRGRARWPGLGLAAMAGMALAGLGVVAVGQSLLRDLIALWPGFAVLRDGQQFVAPLALVLALGAGLGVAWIMARGAGKLMRDVRWLVGLVALISPIVALPGLAWGAGGRLAPVQYPADWMAARRVIARLGPGRVLLLPWAAYRRFGWNNGEAVLDPWPRLLGQTVVWNDAVQVGSIVIPAEDPLARRLTPVISSTEPLTSVLLAAGVRIVIVDVSLGPTVGSGRGYPYQHRLPGSRILLSGPGLVVYQLGAQPPDGPRG